MMGIELLNYGQLTREAIHHFWAARQGAAERQKTSGKADQGERSAVTAGGNMDGFVELAKKVIIANGLKQAEVFTESTLNLPGYFRPTKAWDLIVMHEGQLVAAIEFKSQVGPSFGNNFNNRCEEAIGSATDLWTAYREEAFKSQSKPFLGYLMMLEECRKSNEPVKISSPFFPAFREFENASYAKRYEILCEKLVKERLYDMATLVTSPRDRGVDGNYTEPNSNYGMKSFVSKLAAHIASIAVL